ncbi:MAG: hypothetical protein AB7I42_26495 [Bradyrhizobium sp.]|uniref:hypothetical protein n=1 Tax=Bradyrhizobium sp. TaxID=376 RepID=UPI003D0B76A6
MFLVPGCSARESLSLQYDRRPPQHLIEAAEQIDRTRRPRERRFRLRIGKVTLSRPVLLDLMAQEMVRSFHARGRIEERDLERIGIERSHIRQLGKEAFRRACLDEPRLAKIGEGEE